MRIARAPSLSALLALLLGLAGCVSRPPADVAVLDAADARGVLEALRDFSFEGRAAATRGSTGSQASLAWQQKGDDSFLRLAGPLGMGSTSATMSGERLTIVTSRGERLEGDAAQASLEAQIGMTPPFAALRYWVLGIPAPGGGAQQTLDESGRLASLSQQGWAITFDEYRLQSMPQGRVQMPRRLTASRDDLRLRLVIDRWNLAP